jgi:hypothetical protein
MYVAIVSGSFRWDTVNKATEATAIQGCIAWWTGLSCTWNQKVRPFEVFRLFRQRRRVRVRAAAAASNGRHVGVPGFATLLQI